MKVALLLIALLGMLALTGWWVFDVIHTIGGFNMPPAGWAALIIGVVLSIALGVGLMALVFHSNRKGHDEPPSVIE